jgi:hypothetical protein
LLILLTLLTRLTILTPLIHFRFLWRSLACKGRWRK